MADTTPAAPVAAPAPAPAAPAKTATPPLPAAQVASVSTTPKANPEVPAHPGFQNKGETIESLMKKHAKEAFAPENTGGKELIVTPVEKKEPVKAEAAPAEKPKVPAEKPKTEAPAAPVEADPLAGIEPPEGASEKTVKDWKAFREKASEEINRVKNERASIAAELATYKKASPADAADIAKLKADYQAANDRLAVLDLSAHPDFHRQYTDPKNKALAAADELAKDYQVPNSGEMKALLDLPRPEFAKRLSEMAKDMPSFDQSKFFTSMDEARRLQQEERGALSKAGELRQQLQAKAAQEERKAFEESRSELSTRVPALVIPDGASEERAAEITKFNVAREAALAQAEKFTFGKATPREVADIATRAAALELVATHVLPMTQRDLAQANSLIKELTGKLEAINSKKSAPSFSGDQAPVAKDPSKMTFHDAMEEAKRKG